MQELKEELEQVFKNANVEKWIGGYKVTGLNEIDSYQMADLIAVEQDSNFIEGVNIKRSGAGLTVIIHTF